MGDEKENSMTEIAVNVAVLQNNKILLTQRDDFETWILPGGGVEPGESVAQAAIRETKEETGLEVELTKLVGIYSRLGNLLKGHVVLFIGKQIGGEIKCQPGETIAVEWFPFDQIPGPLSLGHRRRIQDVIDGIGGGTCVSQVFNLQNYPEGIDRKGLYDLRDKSELSPQQFYQNMIEQIEETEKVEVGDV
ncbi:MAG: NUDIX domain-containing protein [Anaerolineales bacterium]